MWHRLANERCLCYLDDSHRISKLSNVAIIIVLEAASYPLYDGRVSVHEKGLIKLQ